MRVSSVARRDPGGRTALSTSQTVPFLAVALVLCLSGAAADELQQGNYTTLAEAFPALGDLDRLANNTSVGGRNGTRCCLFAVRASYQIVDGRVVQNQDAQSRFVDRTPEALFDAQWPCGAEYIGDDNGAPEVKVSWAWCNQNCGGWQKSSNKALSQWVQPFVGFILPSVVFCLNVPRKVVLRIGDTFFPNHYDVFASKLTDITTSLGLLLLRLRRAFRRRRKNGGVVRRDSDESGGSTASPKLNLSSALQNPAQHVLRVVLDSLQLAVWSVLVVLEMVARGTLAAAIAFLDTLGWVAICFAAAAPMILSGLYEATLDRKIVESIQHEGMLIQTRKRARATRYSVEVGSAGGDDQFHHHQHHHRRHHHHVATTQGVRVAHAAASEKAKPPEPGIARADSDPASEMGVESHVKFKQAIHLLYAVLVGNLDFSPADAADDDDAGNPPHPSGGSDYGGGGSRRGSMKPTHLTLEHPAGGSNPNLRRPSLAAGGGRRSSAVGGQGSFAPEPPRSDLISPWRDVRTLVDRFPDREPLPGTRSAAELDNERHITQTRLKSMLGCQASFGAAIGAPILFFLGSFLFSVFSNLTAVGDNDTAHALAFGVWWVTIPHLAIISGCLLAGNNPNTLEVIMTGIASWAKRSHEHTAYMVARRSTTFQLLPEQHGGPPGAGGPNPGVLRRAATASLKLVTSATSGPRAAPGIASPPPHAQGGKLPHLMDMLYKDFYDSVYQPAWMWERGRSKRNWVRRVQRLYGDGAGRRFDMTGVEWINLVALTLFLMATPYVLAFLTSYFTPQIGLSCRSFTFTLYFCFQVVLGLLWLVDFHGDHHLAFTRRVRFPPRSWSWAPASVGAATATTTTQQASSEPDSDGGENDTGPVKERVYTIPTLFAVLTGLALLGSGFTTIAGTLMQVVGVYRNCVCSIPVWTWRSKAYTVVVSTNNAARIYYARRFWLQTGVASILLLIVTCYVGWWYQRHWRMRYANLIDELLGDQNLLLPGHVHAVHFQQPHDLGAPMSPPTTQFSMSPPPMRRRGTDPGGGLGGGGVAPDVSEKAEEDDLESPMAGAPLGEGLSPREENRARVPHESDDAITPAPPRE